ncbi:MAG: acyl-CoA/acyl-ACP dehydrogenase [Chloroflexi bacterium]|nr:acyl-CoA/acyl-ACP dehydrogenase [Chloroflexota bacterium]
MDLSLNEQQEMLRKMARDFLISQCPKSLVREMETDSRGYPPELWREIAQLGWLGLAIPTGYGGEGSTFLDSVVLLDEMGRACFPGPFFSTVILGASTILEAGSNEQKEDMLPRICQGDLLLTLAFAEQHVQYKPDDMSTKATASEDGYVISGTKLFVPDAHVADYMICVARTQDTGNKEQGISLFLVDNKSQGIVYTPLQTITGDKQYEVVLDKVAVPSQSLLGKLDQGWSYLKKVLQKAAVAKCAEMIGGAQYVLEMTVSYAKERVQFERPIGSFQAIQHHCANMATDVDGARLITHQAAWMLSEGLPCAKEIAMAKAWVSDAYQRVTTLGHQVHAGAGFIIDHDMPLYFRRAKAAEVAFGDADFNRELVAQELGL